MRRVIELDALRGLAALAIIAHHLLGPYFGWAWLSVDLFFVLSGYLITSIILRNARSGNFLAAFYIRRGLRIWPIYYLVILALGVIGLFLPWTFIWSESPWYLTFTQYIWQYWGNGEGRCSGGLVHTWTLAIEEQFYLIWPALLLLLGRSRVIPLAVGVAAIAVLARSAGYSQSILMTRCDGFALGGILAAVLTDPRADPARLRSAFRVLAALALGYAAWAAWATSGGFRPLPWDEPVRFGPSMLMVNLGLAAVVGFTVTHAGRPALAPLRSRWLCYCGLISYGLYLYHFPIMMFLEIGFTRFAPSVPRAVVVTTIIAVSFAVAVASWHLIERPILRWKDRFDYRRDPREVVAEAAESPAPLPEPAPATT